MHKVELINAIAQQNKGVSKATLGAMLDATLEVIQQEFAQGGSVTLLGFGIFARSTWRD